MSEVVLTECRADGVGVLTLNRPEAYNTIEQELVDRLPDAVAEVAGCAAVVVTGAGPAFCAGADISRPTEFTGVDAARDWMRDAARGPLALYELECPTIAAIHGAAAGGGLGLALSCDVRIAGPAVVFRAPFARMGLVPDFGCTRLLPLAIGETRAMELFLSCRKMGPEEALAVGLVASLADDPLAAALELAAAVAAMPRGAGRGIKAAVRAAAATDQRGALMDVEAVLQAAGIADPEFAARTAAWFAAK